MYVWILYYFDESLENLVWRYLFWRDTHVPLTKVQIYSRSKKVIQRQGPSTKIRYGRMLAGMISM